MERDRYRRSQEIGGRVLFTEREIELIQLLINGVEAAHDISNIMGIAQDTVRKYREKLIERLREHNIEPATVKRAIAESVWRGLVDTSQLPTQTDAGLTDVETNLVAFCATGYDINYIREKLDLTHFSFKVAKDSLLKKLNVKNLNQVAAVGARELERARTASGSHV